MKERQFKVGPATGVISLLFSSLIENVQLCPKSRNREKWSVPMGGQGVIIAAPVKRLPTAHPILSASLKRLPRAY